ncbi:MAG: DUF748 domain-containing protein [Betaproteobacteria bacterium]
MKLANLKENAIQIAAKPRTRKIGLWLVGLIAAFGLFGFFAAPPIAKSILIDKLGEALHRKVSIDKISINPFALSANIEGFSVKTNEGQEVFGFGSLYVNAQASSIFRGGPVVNEVVLDRPHLQVTRLDQSRYDISDLLDEWSKPSDKPADQSPARFSINNIQVSGGKLEFDDRPAGAKHMVEDLVLRLPFVSNLPKQTDIFVEPHLSAKVNGAPLLVEGRSKPFAASHESELSLDLNQVDVVRYLAYSPTKLPFVLKSAGLEAKIRLNFKQGEKDPAMLKLAGTVQLKNVVANESAGTPLIALKQLDLAVEDADLLQQRLAALQVKVSGVEHHLRLKAGQQKVKAESLSLQASDLQITREAGAAGKENAPRWQAKVAKAALAGNGISYEELGMKEKAIQQIDDLQLALEGFSTAPGSKSTIALNARVNQKGSVKVGGNVQMQPLDASLDLDLVGVPILPAQPFFSDMVNITLLRGQLSAKGHLNLAEGKEGLGGGFKGQIAVGDLHTVDKLNNTDFLRWKMLSADQIDARLQPFALSVGDIALNDFYARMIVTPEGKLNLAQIVREPGDAKAASAPATPPAEGETRPAKAGTAVKTVAPPTKVAPIAIKQFKFSNGTIRFSDYFVKPNYTVSVTKINGNVSGLSSAADSVASLELRGGYGNAAPVSVIAKLNPLAAKRYLDLKGEIRGVDLTTLSTYSGKYAGYAIEKGKLSLFVTYKLENNQLSAENRVFLDQLTFGDKVDSPDATSLPVKLAVALLRNNRGEIDINLPISGSLDDPQFSLGGVIVRVIVNLFVKAVTSPFALLGSMFGGGEELSNIEFAAGQSKLSPEAIKKVEALAKAMNDRPALKLEITGRVDPQADREGGKRAAIERAVRAEKQKDQVKKGIETGSLQTIEVDAREYPEYLKRVYSAAKFAKPRNLVGMQKSLPVEEMEALLMANTEVTDDDMRQLGLRRAQVVQARLVEEGKVAMERLFVMAPKLSGEAKEGEKLSPSRVDFSLR